MKKALMQFLFGGPGTGSPLGDFGLLVLRITFGAYIALHGWGKIYSNGSFGLNPDLIKHVTAMGFPAPMLFAWLAALAEFVGGILVAIGLLTRPAALALVFNMGVAAFKVHGDDPFYIAGPGRSKEAALLYMAAFVALLLAGAGRLAIDYFLRPRAKRAEPRTET